MENKNLKSKKKFHIPHLPIWARILLYAAMLSCFGWTMYVIRYPSDGFIDYIAYFAGSVTLIAGCIYLIPDLRSIGHCISAVLRKNAFINSLYEDIFRRTMFFTFLGVLFNVVYTFMNAYAGLKYSSPWFGSFAAYYILLSLMRLAIMYVWKQTTETADETEKLKKEQNIYYRVSQMLVFMGIIIGGMTVVLMLNDVSGKEYPGSLIYAVALYTFVRAGLAIRNIIVSFFMKSPLMMSLRKVGYVDACVAILNLQLTMIGTFGVAMGEFADQMNLLTGGIACLMTLALGIHGIHRAHREALRQGRVK